VCIPKPRGKMISIR
jgi:hypothetical protein